MDKIGRISARLDATIESMKDMGESRMVDKVVRFTKDTKAEVDELKESPVQIFKKVAKKTERRNAEWLYAAMKEKTPERDYEGMKIDDD